MKKIWDLTLTVESGMPTCGTDWHQRVQIAQMGTIEDVGRNTSSILLGSHSGTHMDAPSHFIPGGKTLEAMDLNILCGPVSVLDFRTKGEHAVLTKEDFETQPLSERIILCLGWYKNWKTKKYYQAFPSMCLEAANFLIEQGVKLVAMDTPSPDPGASIVEKDDSPVHKLLLRNDVVIVEYLADTDQLQPGRNYEIIALPLRIQGADGCPARVIVREL